MNNSELDDIEFLKKTKTKCDTRSTDDDKEPAYWFKHKTNEEMCTAQKHDSVLLKLHNWKSQSETRPEWSEISKENVKLKKYWSQWDRIVLLDNVLYRKWVDTVTEEITCN